VQDRRRDAADEQRRDDRPTRREPALVSVPLTDVQRVELDTVPAKKLLGRAARRSGGLPEEDGAFGHRNEANTAWEPHTAGVLPVVVLAGFIVGRWWIVPVAGVAWAGLLLEQGVVGAADVPGAFALAIANAAVGVAAGLVARWPLRHSGLRRR
jgi:hypothetical protein